MTYSVILENHNVILTFIINYKIKKKIIIDIYYRVIKIITGKLKNSSILAKEPAYYYLLDVRKYAFLNEQ